MGAEASESLGGVAIVAATLEGTNVVDLVSSAIDRRSSASGWLGPSRDDQVEAFAGERREQAKLLQQTPSPTTPTPPMKSLDGAKIGGAVPGALLRALLPRLAGPVGLGLAAVRGINRSLPPSPYSAPAIGSYGRGNLAQSERDIAAIDARIAEIKGGKFPINNLTAGSLLDRLEINRKLLADDLELIKAQNPATESHETEPSPKTATGGGGQKLPPPGNNAGAPSNECWDWSSHGPLSPKSRLPREFSPSGRRQGRWEGQRGNSDWITYNPIVKAFTDRIPFRNNRVDFTQWARLAVNFRPGELIGDHAKDVELTIKKLTSGASPQFPNEEAVRKWVRDNNLAWHHATDTCMQAVPDELNSLIPHIGTASDLRFRNLPGLRNGND
jgi:hypothetical protein